MLKNIKRKYRQRLKFLRTPKALTVENYELDFIQIKDWYSSKETIHKMKMQTSNSENICGNYIWQKVF